MTQAARKIKIVQSWDTWLKSLEQLHIKNAILVARVTECSSYYVGLQGVVFPYSQWMKANTEN